MRLVCGKGFGYLPSLALKSRQMSGGAVESTVDPCHGTLACRASVAGTSGQAVLHGGTGGRLC